MRSETEMGEPSRRYTVDWERASFGSMFRAAADGAPETVAAVLQTALLLLVHACTWCWTAAGMKADEGAARAARRPAAANNRLAWRPIV